MALTLVWNIDTLYRFMKVKETKRMPNSIGYCSKSRTDGFMGAGASATYTVAEVNNNRLRELNLLHLKNRTWWACLHSLRLSSVSNFSCTGHNAKE